MYVAMSMRTILTSNSFEMNDSGAKEEQKKKGKRQINKEDRAVNMANTQPSSEYFSVRPGFILIL